MGVPSLNYYAVDRTLNTTNQPTNEALIQSSRYLAQNVAIWLADEVLRYRDHDIRGAKTIFLDTWYATIEKT